MNGLNGLMDPRMNQNPSIRKKKMKKQKKTGEREKRDQTFWLL